MVSEAGWDIGAWVQATAEQLSLRAMGEGGHGRPAVDGRFFLLAKEAQT